ncbi:MAG: hypothetical protein KKA42_16710 [candidate division Zixibacteria bacterium]|nr:hypothetical protein [candidate division Zixibacteria bacterium]
MKNLLILGGLLLAVGLLCAACSDDEGCPVCARIDSQTGVLSGDLRLWDDRLSFEAYITPVGTAIPVVDSVTVNGSAADVYAAYSDGRPYIEIDYDVTFDRRIPAAQDSVRINIYTPSGISSAVCTALNRDIDTVLLVSPAANTPYDTVATGAPVNMVWRSNAAADWYGFSYYHNYTDSGQYVSEGPFVVWTTDTSFSILGADNSYVGDYLFTTHYATGPLPDSEEGSLSGGTIKGSIVSVTEHTFRVFVRELQDSSK